MGLNITKHIETLAQKDADIRRQAVANVLTSENITYRLQTSDVSKENPRGICNYLFSTGTSKASLLFCAHYDSHPASCGANDNASSICILIELAKTFEKENISADFAFFDGEENGNSGSKLYIAEMDTHSISAVINLDVCGYGSNLVIHGNGYEKKPVFSNFCNKELLETHHVQLVDYLPPSDDHIFSKKGIPALSIAVVPYWDIQYLKTLASYGSGILGRPPEFDMILGEMDVMNTMHGGQKDSVEWIEPEAMDKVYHYLLEGIKIPVTEKKKKINLLSLFK